LSDSQRLRETNPPLRESPAIKRSHTSLRASESNIIAATKTSLLVILPLVLRLVATLEVLDVSGQLLRENGKSLDPNRVQIRFDLPARRRFLPVLHLDILLKLPKNAVELWVVTSFRLLLLASFALAFLWLLRLLALYLCLTRVRCIVLLSRVPVQTVFFDVVDSLSPQRKLDLLFLHERSLE